MALPSDPRLKNSLHAYKERTSRRVTAVTRGRVVDRILVRTGDTPPLGHRLSGAPSFSPVRYAVAVAVLLSATGRTVDAHVRAAVNGSHEHARGLAASTRRRRRREI